MFVRKLNFEKKKSKSFYTQLMQTKFYSLIFHADSKSDLKILVPAFFFSFFLFSLKKRGHWKAEAPILGIDKTTHTITVSRFGSLNFDSSPFWTFQQVVGNPKMPNPGFRTLNSYSDSKVGFEISAKNWFRNRYSVFSFTKSGF